MVELKPSKYTPYELAKVIGEVDSRKKYDKDMSQLYHDRFRERYGRDFKNDECIPNCGHCCAMILFQKGYDNMQRTYDCENCEGACKVVQMLVEDGEIVD